MGLDAGRRVGRDRAEGAPAAPRVGRPVVAHRLNQRTADCVGVPPPTIVWINGELHDSADGPRLALRPRPDRRRRRVRDDEGRRGRARSPHAATCERLHRSANGLALAIPRSTTPSSAPRCTRDDRGQRRTTGRVRITVTGGVGPLGSERGSTGVDGDRRHAPTQPSGRRARPWSPCPWRRNEHSAVAGLKTTSLRRERGGPSACPRARRRRGHLRQHRGHLCEGTGTNIFVGIAGRLYTPPLASGCLAGIIRGLVVEAGRR